MGPADFADQFIGQWLSAISASQSHCGDDNHPELYVNGYGYPHGCANSYSDNCTDGYRRADKTRH
jgi:hypothetical protein